eukprot:12885226-Prorocentrum_lima.AAC.1
MADKLVTFKESSIFKSLRTVSPRINLDEDIKVWESHLILESNVLTVASGVHVQSEIENIYVEPIVGGDGI